MTYFLRLFIFRLKSSIEATAPQLVMQAVVKRTRNEAKGKSLAEEFVLKVILSLSFLLHIRYYF
jgi:hypothetical protein